jgi:uncharacterized protein YndB with AHSA1/START domain
VVDILHQVGIRADSADRTYDALTTVDGLAGWWTEDTTGDPGVGGTVAFRFGELGGFDMEVTELVPGERVRWLVVDGPPEWIGTHVDWDLRQDDGHTLVRFTHEGWAEPVDFMRHCSTKWATFLLSLKSLVETGTGAPSPNDVKIDAWN